MQSARSVSHSGKTLRWYLSFRPVAVLAAAFAALLTTGLVAGSFAGAAGAATAHAKSHALATTGLGYTALSSPIRIADTRTGATDPATYAGGTLAGGTGLTVDIPSSSGVPSNASAVVVNITAISPSNGGFLSAYPGGGTNPGTANVTFTKGQTVGNMVTVGLGPDSATGATQSFTVYNGPATGGGTVDFAADVMGYYAPSGGSYVGLAPSRIYDSRTGSGEPGAGTTLTTSSESDNVTVAGGTTGVPATATAVVLNVAITNPTASSFITAYPTGTNLPGTANQNFLTGETLSSQVVAGVGTSGDVTITNHSGSVDVVVDVDGYYTSSGAGSLLTILGAPVRLTDTRANGNVLTGSGGVAGGASATAVVQGTGATAGVLSLADITTPGDGNFLTAYPTGGAAPLAASDNYVPADTYNIVENSTYATTGTGGSVSILNGPSNASPANVVVDEFGYFSSASATAYTVTPGYGLPTTTGASTAAATSGGVESYSVSGLPASGLVNIALFPCSGTAQTGNGPTDGAPTVSASGTTFTAPGGTSPTAGNAVGQGTSSANGAPATAGYSTGTLGANDATAFIESVNGVTTSDLGGAGGNGPTQVYSDAATSAGTMTFVVNSFSADCEVPVVYTAPSSAGSTPALLVSSSGAPQAGYATGIGDLTVWSAAAAPATPAASPYFVMVNQVNTATNSFSATVLAGGPAGTPPLADYSFSYGTSGSTYSYTDATPITQATFSADLSAYATGFEPNSTTATTVEGDVIEVGNATTGYATGTAAPFAFDAAPGFFGDVPGTATNANATYNGCAYEVASVCTPADVVTWTPPANADVSGAEAVPGGTTLAGNASYNIWASVLSSGTLGAAHLVGTVTVSSSSTVNNGDGQLAAGCNAAVTACTYIGAPEFIDTTEAQSSVVVYYVTATAATPSGGQTGPYSSATAQVTVGAAATTPTIDSVVITPSTCTANCGANAAAAPTGTPGSASITYNEAVTCAAPAAADFTYSNGLSPTGSYGITGASCAGASSTTLVITFPLDTTTFSAPNTYYTYQAVAAPNTGDSFGYAPPATNTPTFAVYAGSSTSPIYEGAQSVIDNGNPTPVTNSGTLTSPSNPLY